MGQGWKTRPLAGSGSASIIKPLLSGRPGRKPGLPQRNLSPRQLSPDHNLIDLGPDGFAKQVFIIMILWLCLLAALAGVLNPVQSGANGEMGRVLGNPFGVVLLSLSISLAFTLVAGLFTRNGDTSASAI
jgi:hypothetical protein